jgi:hypothetical protein
MFRHRFRRETAKIHLESRGGVFRRSPVPGEDLPHRPYLGIHQRCKIWIAIVEQASRPHEVGVEGESSTRKKLLGDFAHDFTVGVDEFECLRCGGMFIVQGTYLFVRWNSHARPYSHFPVR